MSIKSNVKSALGRVRHSSKKTKLIALAVVGVVLVAGVVVGMQVKRNIAKTNKKPATTTKTITTKSGKKITVNVPTTQQTPQQRAKAADERLQKHIDSALKQKRITKDQAKLIKDKYAALAKVSTKDMKDRTKVQKELYAWIKENKIPVSFMFELSRPRA